MSGIGLSVAEIQRWNAVAVRDVFYIGQHRASAALETAEGLSMLHVFDSWGGDAAEAARAALAQTRMDLDAHGREAMMVAHAARSAADGIEAVQLKLRSLIAEAQQHGLTVNEVTSKIEFASTITNPTEALIYRLDLQSQLNALLAEADAIDDALACAIDMADGDAPIIPVSAPGREIERRLKNQIKAFATVFGRRPSSSADWTTAAQLDSHSYDPKNQNIPANVVVGRIKPVPGKGVVRASLFIPAESVKAPVLHWPGFNDDAGDGRGFNPAAGPEESRVALEVDYENGAVIARQNPSVNLTTGQVRAGSPDVRVAQRGDGSVYIRYAAANPFSPGGEGVAKKSICVQGNIVVRPGDGVPRVAGFVTAFPALEIYHDRSANTGFDVPSTTTVARMWPTIDGEWGPAAGLGRATTVGSPHLPLPLSAASESNSLNLRQMTRLGSSSNPPTVVSG